MVTDDRMMTFGRSLHNFFSAPSSFWNSTSRVYKYSFCHYFEEKWHKLVKSARNQGLQS